MFSYKRLSLHVIYFVPKNIILEHTHKKPKPTVLQHSDEYNTLCSVRTRQNVTFELDGYFRTCFLQILHSMTWIFDVLHFVKFIR